MSVAADSPPAPRRKRWKWRAGLALVVLAGLCIASFGCVSTVRPPAAPEDPVSVFLILDDRHLGLMLPVAGKFVEYGFGDWDWYALMKDSWYHAFDTVLWPTQGALARREVAVRNGDELARRFSWMEIHELRVSRAAAVAVVEGLEADYQSRIEGEIYNSVYGMSFVPHPDGYWFLHNCNDAVAEWLRALGCTVSWVPIRLGLSVAE